MKKIIIIVIVVVLLIALGIGAFFFLHAGPSTGTGTATTTQPTPTSTNPGGLLNASSAGSTSGGTFLALSDAGITASDITPGEPSDAPQGPTIMFQTASGTITLNNFYTTAQGYWAPLNVLLLADGPSYAIWYYRGSSQFEIDIPPDGGLTDQDDAATELSGMLGISQQGLCSLPVTVAYAIDQGADDETAPLDFCTSAPGVINPQ